MAIPLAAVMLEDDGAAVGEAGEFCFGDDGLAIEDDGDFLAANGDFEAVPFAHWFVGLQTRGRGGAGGSRLVAIHAHAIHFAGASRPAPDVHLVFGGAAKVNAGVGIGQRELEFFAGDVFGVAAVRQDVRYVRIRVRSLFNAPIEFENKVFVGLG